MRSLLLGLLLAVGPLPFSATTAAVAQDIEAPAGRLPVVPILPTSAVDTLALRRVGIGGVQHRVAPAEVRPEFAPRASIDLAIAERIRGSTMAASPAGRVVVSTFGFAGLPGSLLLAGVLYGAGELMDDEELSDTGIHAGQAIVLAGTATLAGKLVVGRARPHVSPDDPSSMKLGRGLVGDAYRSFPSAHSAAAFATASLVSVELLDRRSGSRLWVPPTTFGTAILAGIARMYQEEHWATDVAAGALIGGLSGWGVAAFHRGRSGPSGP